MSSPQSNKWLSYFDEPLLDDVGVGQPANPFFWCGQGINDQPDVSVEIDGPNKDMDEQDKLCPRKRSREESSGGPGSKACREKMRRDRLNDRFMELSSVLEPGRPPKTADKATILSDAARVMTQLRTEAQNLKAENERLQEAIKDLKAEKNELRDEKLRMKAEKEKLEQQVKAMALPTGFVPHPAAFHAAAAFAAQSQAAANKTMPVPGYPGMAMWQWMPPAVVDTSQDHVLRPPVA